MSFAIPNYVPIHEPITSSALLTTHSFRSTLHGLTVSLAVTTSPIISLRFIIPTETVNSDSGIPHTLEHLTFLRSERYPFKGALDKLANRAMGQGTNAYTAQDVTVYEFDGASVSGTLALLPVYADHIFNPTLKSEAFTTEVFHVTGEGTDGGVVFCEMQGTENSPGDLVPVAFQRAAYAKSSGYRSNTGGLMNDLRTLTNDEIREYHARYYVPDNCRVLVSGNIDPEEVMRSIQASVDPILARFNGKTIERPFVTTDSAIPTDFKEDRTLTVPFPSAESTGEVSIYMIGPTPDQTENVKATEILLEYFSSTAISPLQAEMVEIDEPLCTDIQASTSDRASGNEICFSFRSVPKAKLQDIMPEFKRILSSHTLDLERLRVLIERDAVATLEDIEAGAKDFAESCITQDHLYGTTDGASLTRCLQFRQLSWNLASYGKETWEDLVKKFLKQNSSISIIATPSAELAVEIQEQDKKRVEATKSALGDTGLAEKAELLREAQEINSIPVPDAILEAFEIPSIDSIKWIDVSSHKDPDSTLPTYFVQTQTEFVDINISLVLTSLSEEHQLLLPLFAEAIQSLPLTKSDGTRLTRDQVTAQLDIDTLEYDCFRLAEFPDVLSLRIRVKRDNTEKGLNWAHDLICSADFNEISLLSVALSKIEQNLPERRRDGGSMMTACYQRLMLRGATAAAGLLEQSIYVPELQRRVTEDSSLLTLLLTSLRNQLLHPSNWRLIISGDIKSLPDVRCQAQRIFSAIKSGATLNVPWPRDNLTSIGEQPSKKACIIPVASCDSAFALYTSKGLQNGYMDDDLPALYLTCEWLNALEGHLYRTTRGSGLAYGAYLIPRAATGTCKFELYRSSDAHRAWEASGAVMRKLASGAIDINSTEIASTVSALAFSKSSQESSPSQACDTMILNTEFRRVAKNYDQSLLKIFATIKKHDIVRVMKKYILPIFDATTSVAVVALNPGRVAELKAALEHAGFIPEIYENNSQSDNDTDSDNRSE